MTTEDTTTCGTDATTNPASASRAAASTAVLALDLGKFKSVACVFDPATGSHRFASIATTPSAVHDLLVEVSPATLVIEACSVCGWVHDLAQALGVVVRVANANNEAWKWKRVKRKTDRDDALKLAKLSATDQLPTVHVPNLEVRQHRALIKHRHALVDRRTGIKNTIRSLLDAQGLSMPARSRGWTVEAIREFKTLSKPLADCSMSELWKGQLAIELSMLESVSALVREADRKLDAIAAKDERITRLRSMPQVGPRVAELVVTTLDDARRFKTASQVSAYAGLVPKQYQSGQMNRLGRARASCAGCWCRRRGACRDARAHVARKSSTACATANAPAASRRRWRWPARSWSGAGRSCGMKANGTNRPACQPHSPKWQRQVDSTRHKRRLKKVEAKTPNDRTMNQSGGAVRSRMSEKTRPNSNNPRATSTFNQCSSRRQSE